MVFKKAVWSGIAALVFFVSTATAQTPSGTISGRVLDATGLSLPGVTVTLQGADLTQTYTTDGEGRYRFLELAPGSYKVTSVLQGFATHVRENVVLDLGKTVSLPVTMAISGFTETITVAAPSPIVDGRQTGTATNFTADELSKIPTSRDPFSMMRSVPGVLVDRVNIGGNETGQQSNFAPRALGRRTRVWTLDGVAITDMALTGSSPTYFNYDNFDAIHVTTAGHDHAADRRRRAQLRRQAGDQLFHGGARGYFDNESTEWSNVPAELKALGVTPETADHNKRISDFGFDIGGPLLRDKAWFYGSYSIQDMSLVRRAGTLVDRTQLKNPNVKVNWQASGKDMVSFLYFDGFKIKDNRSPGTPGITLDAPTATFHQDNAYTDNPAARAVEARGRPRARARTCSCRRSTCTTTPASSSRPKGA